MSLILCVRSSLRMSHVRKTMFEGVYYMIKQYMFVNLQARLAGITQMKRFW